MNGSRIRRPFGSASLMVLIASSLALLLGACGVTDSAGTNFRIVLESLTLGEEDTLAPIGALQLGEEVKVTFLVTRDGQQPVDRTSQATFELVDKHSDDDATLFNLALSPDLEAQPFHVLTSFVEDARATLCAAYSGPELLGDAPFEVCMGVLTYAPGE